ncbi:BTB/POZ domain-containing protein 17-like isoform X2 [Haliotis rufescens]|uniref:BTB/POZ domain-containing protein 17-like isoform X2 n=1 Tax=Haliotis rufescens TaxID=6454 RepID=UPI00201F39C9|nr:BTB/POZ domain-containing protein 17-like isoform X2 [Haliotis rufescens]
MELYTSSVSFKDLKCLKMESESSPGMLQQHDNYVLRDEGDFIKGVSQFYNQEALSDVQLKIGKDTYYAHKFVLAKSSEVFRAMLYESRWTQPVKPEVELNESPECQQHFDRFLRFLYTAEVNISVDSAVGILCLADKYSVLSLKQLCTRYMVDNTRSPKVRNALNWYSWAKALNMEELIDQCSKTIAWNMETLLMLPEWYNMDIEFVSDILHNSDLVVSSEFHLYKAVRNWLLHENHVPNFSDYAKELLPLIRFPQMLVDQLYKIETDADLDLDDQQCKSQLQDLISQAYRYRSLCPAQSQLEISFVKPYFLPRDYTDLTVDTVRMQNTLRFGIQVDVRTSVGPVPSDNRDGEWKITYRKTNTNNEGWTIQIYAHESALINGEARIQATLVICDEEEKVIQVERSDTYVCSRGNSLSMNVVLPTSEEAKAMGVIIKQVPK